MIEFTTYAATVADLPVGTRVARHGGDTLIGTVTGHAGASVCVRWDNGGTSAGPASHGLWIVTESTTATTVAGVTRVACTNANAYYYYGQHLASDTPTSQTAPVKWCPVCLGLGTVAL